jgi:hypothetical protein
MHRSVLPLAQTILQQCSGLPDAWKPFVLLIQTINTALVVTDTVQCHARELVTPSLLSSSLCAAVQLLPQLQRCVLLLPAAGISTGGSSSSGSSSGISPLGVCVKAQSAQASFINRINAMLQEQKLDAAAAEQVQQLLLDPAVQQLLLQPMVAWVAMLHQDHVSEQQQQRQLQSGRLSRQQLQQADLLPIPAFHQEMLQLLPGGQAYVDAAAPSGDQSSKQSARTMLAYSCATALNIVMQQLLDSASRDTDSAGKQWLNKDAPILSAAAVRLVLELQLLAAGEMQRQRQQQQQQRGTVALLLNCNFLLTAQIKALAHIGYDSSSCLPPEVLQQAGLQLLQALAAPLQQLQLCSPQDQLLELATHGGTSTCLEGLRKAALKQLYVLRAAASGFNIVHEAGKPRTE